MKQGLLGDCWFLCACAALQKSRHLLDQVSVFLSAVHGKEVGARRLNPCCVGLCQAAGQGSGEPALGSQASGRPLPPGSIPPGSASPAPGSPDN